MNDVVYKNEQAKLNAIARDVTERSQKGQPILVGTVSIEKSEEISRALSNNNIKHKVLNAKHHEKEAEIVAQAGRKGAITIATNMAGRGTDIVLGGNPEMLAKSIHPDGESEEYKQALARFTAECEGEKQQVLDAGGLYIVGTERHESRRIDNQLRGRSGRQGDPGASMFYLSLEDDLMRKFNGEAIQKIMTRLNVPEEEPITAKMVTRSIEGAQRKVEGHNFEIRKHLLEYDDVMNQQRKTIYAQRRSLLEKGDSGETQILETVKEMLSEVTSDILDKYASEEVKRELWDLEGLDVAIEKQFGVDLDIPADIPSDSLMDLVIKKVGARFEEQKEHMGPIFENVQKSVLLGAIDHYWKEHLQKVDRIRDWVNLKAYAQKDPLLEYKKETFMAFEEMNQLIRQETTEKLMKVRIVREDSEEEQRAQEEEVLASLQPKGPKKMTASQPSLESTGVGASPSSPGRSSSQGEGRPQRSRRPPPSRSQRRKMDKGKKPKKLF